MLASLIEQEASTNMKETILNRRHAAVLSVVVTMLTAVSTPLRAARQEEVARQADR